MTRMLLILNLLITLSCPLLAQRISGSSNSSGGKTAPQGTSVQVSSTTALQQKQSELSQLERQLEQLRKQIDMQKKKEGQAIGTYGASTTQIGSRAMARRIVLPGIAPSSANFLVVSGASVDPERISTILEDMRVMARILEKELKDLDISTHQGFFNQWGTSEHGIEGLYLDGYGLVLELEVGFPLLAPKDANKQEETEAVGDKVWSETRQEIFEPNRKRYKEKDKQKPYDAKKVESLKDTLARTLRHASNIRALKSNECVAIVVTSGRAANNMMMLYGMDGLGYGDAMSTGLGGGEINGSNASVQQGPSVLTLKAAKTHIDAFAQDQLDLDQFRAELQTTLY